MHVVMKTQSLVSGSLFPLKLYRANQTRGSYEITAVFILKENKINNLGGANLERLTHLGVLSIALIFNSMPLLHSWKGIETNFRSAILLAITCNELCFAHMPYVWDVLSVHVIFISRRFIRLSWTNTQTPATWPSHSLISLTRLIHFN